VVESNEHSLRRTERFAPSSAQKSRLDPQRLPPPAAFALFIDRIVLSVETVLVKLNDARRIAMSLPEVTE